MINFIRHHTEKHGALFNSYFAEEPEPLLINISESIADAFLAGGKLFLCGSGLSLWIADYAAHIFMHHSGCSRPPLPAISLRADAALINTEDPHDIFEKQLTSLISERDVVWGFSAGGNCESVVRALRAASMNAVKTISTVGEGCRITKGVSDIHLAVEDADLFQVQQMHMILVHIVCSLVEKTIFDPLFKREQ